MGEDSEMRKVTRKELADNVLRPAFKNEKFEDTENICCSDVSTTFKQLHMNVYGIKVCINNSNLNKSIIVFGIVDDVMIDFLNNNYIVSKQKMITHNLPEEIEANKEAFDFFISSLTLKDYLICDTSADYYTRFMGYLNQNSMIHQKQISVAVKEFISDEIFNKRNTLIQLLIKSSHVENQYLAYLLYDLLSNDTNGSIDSQEQIIIFDSFSSTALSTISLIFNSFTQGFFLFR